MKQLDQIKAASLKSEDGSVNAVFEINVPLVVTAGFDADEIENLNEGDIHASLSELAGELISQISMEDAIKIGGIIELREGDLPESIIDGILEPDMRSYAVIGRIPYDDEDTCHVIQAASRREAMEKFADLMYEDAVGEDREANIANHGGDLGVFINHILVSASEIREAE